MADLVKKNGVNFGIIIGVISIVATTLMYVIDVKMFANFWVGLILFFISLIVGIIAVAKTKQGMGGYISFKHAFSVYFIAMAIGAALGTIFMYILFNFIDPGAKEVVINAAIEKTVTMMQNFNVKTEDIRQTVDKMKENDNFTILNQLKSYVFGLIFYIIIGLIVAAAFKKNKPEFE